MQSHFRLWTLATLVWAGFLVAGLPDYYQEYSRPVMIGFEVLLLFPISAILYVVLKRVPRERRMSRALWIALYFTLPLAIYDYVYCGVLLGRGVAFLWEFWYLTVYYAVPWFLAPAIVWIIRRAGGDRHSLASGPEQGVETVTAGTRPLGKMDRQT